MDTSLIGSAVTVLFFVVFIGIVWWAYHKDNRAKYDEAARMPLEEDVMQTGPAHSEEKAQ